MNANLEEVIEVVIVLFSWGAWAFSAAVPLMDCGVSSALWEPNNPPMLCLCMVDMSVCVLARTCRRHIDN